jgi:hypothetical protein
MMNAVYVDVLPTDAQLPDRNKSVMLVIVDGEDGLIMNQVENLFSVSQFDIRRVLTSSRLSHRKLTGPALLTIQEEGLMSFQAKQATFIPRSSLWGIIDFIGTSDDRKLFHLIWPEPRKAKSEPAIPRRSFRCSVIRNLRKHSEEIRRMQKEIDELRVIVEDLLHADMQSMTMNMARNKVTPKDSVEMSSKEPE